MPKPFPCSPGTGKRGCRSRDPPRLHKLLSASRQEASQGREQERAGGGGVGEEEKGTSHLCMTLAFQPRSHESARGTSAQFYNEWTLAPASKMRKLRLRDVKGSLQGHPAGDWGQSQVCQPPKTVSSPPDTTEGESRILRPPFTFPLMGHLG